MGVFDSIYNDLDEAEIEYYHNLGINLTSDQFESVINRAREIATSLIYGLTDLIVHRLPDRTRLEWGHDYSHHGTTVGLDIYVRTDQ